MEGELYTFLIDCGIVRGNHNLFETACCGDKKDTLEDLLNGVTVYILNQVCEGACRSRLAWISNLADLDVDVSARWGVLVHEAFDGEFAFALNPIDTFGSFSRSALLEVGLFRKQRPHCEGVNAIDAKLVRDRDLNARRRVNWIDREHSEGQRALLANRLEVRTHYHVSTVVICGLVDLDRDRFRFVNLLNFTLFSILPNARPDDKPIHFLRRWRATDALDFEFEGADSYICCAGEVD